MEAPHRNTSRGCLCICKNCKMFNMAFDYACMHECVHVCVQVRFMQLADVIKVIKLSTNEALSHV